MRSALLSITASLLLPLLPMPNLEAAETPAPVAAPSPPKAPPPPPRAKVRPRLPEGVTVERDIPYLGPGREEKADLYLPARGAAEQRIPAVVVIHGGGWSGGDKDSAREWNICGTLASHGYAALSINYLLRTPELNAWPRNLHDCKTAVRWLRQQADHYGLDPEHIGAIGGSAGGHLAAMLAVTGTGNGLEPAGPRGECSARISCVVDLYGPIVYGHGGSIRATDDPQSSPFAHLDASDPPFLILHGTEDKTVAVDRSRELAAALAKAGVEHELVVVEGGVHSFHLQPPQRDLRPLVLGFFDQHLKRRP